MKVHQKLALALSTPHFKTSIPTVMDMVSLTEENSGLTRGCVGVGIIWKNHFVSPPCLTYLLIGSLPSESL